MLIKEYRIPMPLKVEEYRIAQLYMIQKKSRQETSGAGSGVEIIRNEPYSEGPGGSGQYTYKIYHIGSHIPGWFRSILPSSVLKVTEEAWNAYPYTRTRYTCPFVERFSLEIDTIYLQDSGVQENVFKLNANELQERQIDVIDMVKDAISASDYVKDEDPKLFKSTLTGRGPLTDDWVAESSEKLPIMCAYKLCKVEFRYWGMQSKIERFIHDIALRKTMLRAHRQAWAWQDEWNGLSILDIRKLEEQTRQELRKTMDAALKIDTNESNAEEVALLNGDQSPFKNSLRRPASRYSTAMSGAEADQIKERLAGIRKDSDSSETTEFFDARETYSDSEEASGAQSLMRSSSNELLPTTDPPEGEGTISGAPVDSCKYTALILVFHGGSVLDSYSSSESLKQNDVNTFRTVLENVCRAHYQAVSDSIALLLVPCPAVCAEALNVLLSLCPYGHLSNTASTSILPPVPSPIYPLSLPSSHKTSLVGPQSSVSGNLLCCDALAPQILPVLACDSKQFSLAVGAAILKANQVYYDWRHSDEGKAFKGEVCILADYIGGLLAWEAVCSYDDALIPHSDVSEKQSYSPQLRHSVSPSDHYNSAQSIQNSNNKLVINSDVSEDGLAPLGLIVNRLQSFNRSPRLSASSGDDEIFSNTSTVLSFTVSRLFLLGCPLGLVLAHQKLKGRCDSELPHPQVMHFHNLFYPLDPCCARLEPLIWSSFTKVPPVSVPRYQRFPLGDGQATHIVECVQRHCTDLFINAAESPSQKQFFPTDKKLAAKNLLKITSQWWGHQRIDYALYSPEGLSNLPQLSLPALLHASFWESQDVAAFIARQLAANMQRFANSGSIGQLNSTAIFSLSYPCEKWQKQRTAFKIKNIQANHRANDVVILDNESVPQTLNARFCYGPLVNLSGEMVDIYVLEGEQWKLYATEFTDNNGRLSYTLVGNQRRAHGLWPVKMVVRGDHTFLDMILAIVPERTETCVFSIDGAFTASMSITGKDPKVRPGAVDIVRHWQELGFLLLYVTARPNVQQRQVVTWLQQHNFPHGLLFFTDGISTDPLRQKTQYLRNLKDNHILHFQAAYGSSKDIQVYSQAGIGAETIFVIGKMSKRNQTHANFIQDGYSYHFQDLKSGVISACRSAQGNGRMILRNSYFQLSGSHYRSAMSVQRSHSFTPRTGKYSLSTESTDSPTTTTAMKSGRTRAKSPFILVRSRSKKE